MNLPKLTAQLELAASFSDRQALVEAAAAEASPAELKEIARLLNHRVLAVRLGAIEILERARFRPVLPILAAATRQRRGDERVLAARAVSRLAQREDRETLEPLARAWLGGADKYLHGHGQALLAALGVGGDASPASASPASASPGASADRPGAAASATNHDLAGITAPDRVQRARALSLLLARSGAGAALVQGLLASKHAGVRVDLLQALASLGGQALVAAAPHLLERGDSDVVALIGRALLGHLGELAEAPHTRLRTAIERAQRRLSGDELAISALHECLLELEVESAIDTLAAQVDTLAVDTVQRIATHIAALPPERRRPLLPKLLAAFEYAPRRALLFADSLHAAWPELRPPRRAALREILSSAAGSALPRGLPDASLRAIGQLYALALEPGARPPEAVLLALDRSDDAAVLSTAVAIHETLATEAAARRLAAYLDEPDEAVRAAAHQALLRLSEDAEAPYRVRFRDDGKAEIAPDYRTPEGEALRAEHGSLRSDSGEAYLLDARGRPVAERDTEWRGCRCCERPRVLVREGDERPTCPVTGEAHLLEDGRTVLERDHPLGGCDECESVAPLLRHGNEVRCETCETTHVQRRGRYRAQRRPREHAEIAEPLPQDQPLAPQPQTLPTPPSASDLELVEPAIARAMAANVFVLGSGLEQSWTGSGVIVARDGNELAILTNRHVVEDVDAGGRSHVASVRVYTISGELKRARVVWRAERGMDLALLSIRIDEPERVTVTELQAGPCVVGERLFSIGNPLGLSWSYASGTLAAFRTFTSKAGLEVRFVHSHVNMSHGSSGGGLYHEKGHLVGINSFIGGTAVGPGGVQSFSIAMPSALDALRREGVRFAGKPLVP
ncbi:S1 family peptidase [Haliangium ochraceum]|nr:serine protease [Haliangium ochraceum]